MSEAAPVSWYEHAIGLVAVRGKDRHGLLHRLCSQDVLPLASGNLSARALLTTHQGRLIDVLDMFEYDAVLWLKTAAGRAEQVREWIERYVIMEDVVCETIGEALASLWVLGAQKTAPASSLGLCATALGLEAVPAAGAVASMTWSGEHAVVKRVHPAYGGGLEVIHFGSPGPCASFLRSQLGAPKSALELEARRLCAGVPSALFEYREAAAPFELRLVADTVHWHKGCYIGQEVLSRMEAYDKVARLLMGVTSTRGSGSLETHFKQARLRRDGKVVGRMTSFVAQRLSASDEATEDGFVGLALLKREAASPGEAELYVPEEGDRPAAVTSVELEDRPFWA